jgi:uncharacterized protein YndB with AHSA1/START domain
MTMANTLKINAQSDREIVMTRMFDAPRNLVYDAYTKPDLLKRWLGVFGGWTMPICEMDVRAGGSYRWVWRGSDGTQMGVRGVFREVLPNERLVATEKFDDAWYPGEGLNTTTFVEKGGKTTLTQTMRYESREARDAVLKSPMETGVAASFDGLERMLESGEIGGTKAGVRR